MAYLGDASVQVIEQHWFFMEDPSPPAFISVPPSLTAALPLFGFKVAEFITLNLLSMLERSNEIPSYKKLRIKIITRLIAYATTKDL